MNITKESSAMFHGDLVNTNRILYTPSDFAKMSLLHIQEVGFLQANKPHISKRENLSSYLFFMVHSGSGILVYKGITYQLTAGTCVFIDCSEPYSHETSENLWSLSWIHFNGPTAANIYQKYIDRGGLPAFIPKDVEAYQHAHSDIYSIASATSYTRDMEINTALSSLLTILMVDAWSHDISLPSTKKAILYEIKQYLDQNYANKITLDQLSERYFINKYYLTRIFKEQFGVSIMDYLLNVRITEAKNQLRFTDKSADEIGIACGIGDIYYFSKVFKKVEGIGIKKYRQLWG